MLLRLVMIRLSLVLARCHTQLWFVFYTTGQICHESTERKCMSHSNLSMPPAACLLQMPVSWKNIFTYLHNLRVLEQFKESPPALGCSSTAWPLISKGGEVGDSPQGSTKYYNHYSGQKVKQFVGKSFASAVMVKRKESMFTFRAHTAKEKRGPERY